MWFKNSYRRHLADMHINDWGDGRFLSEFSAEEYYNNLKKANVKSAMIYLQSHVGYCYFPTKVGHIHGAFKDRPYEMKKLIELCRNNGIDVISYYSINYNTLEAKTHPEWSVIYDSNGSMGDFSGKRYLLCCPNNPEYRSFVLTQAREMVEYANFTSKIYFVCCMYYQRGRTSFVIWSNIVLTGSRVLCNGYIPIAVVSTCTTLT
jgi:hypothetical protein